MVLEVAASDIRFLCVLEGEVFFIDQYSSDGGAYVSADIVYIQRSYKLARLCLIVSANLNCKMCVL